MKYLILFILSTLVTAAVSVDSSKTGKAPARTTQTACTLVVTPADADVTAIGLCYRDGRSLIIDGQILYAGAGTAGALTISIASVAGSPVIDVAYLVGGAVGDGGSGSNKNEALLGYGFLFSAGSAAWFTYNPVYKTTTTFEFAGGSAHLQGNVPASGSSLKFHVDLPIVGWY